jgi:hypothetical protein
MDTSTPFLALVCYSKVVHNDILYRILTPTRV